MGSQVNEAPELVVLVTGFQPFQARWPVNPSWEIAKSLPSHLPPLPTKDLVDEPAARRIETPPVRILVHPEPLRVNYNKVRDLVPTLWDRDGPYNADVVIHMGMSGPRTFYQLERRAHRRGYRLSDVDGALPDEGMDGRPDDEDWIWYGLPDEIVSDLDIDCVHRRWVTHSSDMDLRISDDPGRFLCDWTYYCSLAHCLKADRPRKVCFFHVPAGSSESAVAQGRELALNLIRSIAESEVMSKRGVLADKEA